MINIKGLINHLNQGGPGWLFMADEHVKCQLNNVNILEMYKKFAVTVLLDS